MSAIEVLACLKKKKGIYVPFYFFLPYEIKATMNSGELVDLSQSSNGALWTCGHNGEQVDGSCLDLNGFV